MRAKISIFVLSFALHTALILFSSLITILNSRTPEPSDNHFVKVYFEAHKEDIDIDFLNTPAETEIKQEEIVTEEDLFDSVDTYPDDDYSREDLFFAKRPIYYEFPRDNRLMKIAKIESTSKIENKKPLKETEKVSTPQITEKISREKNKDVSEKSKELGENIKESKNEELTFFPASVKIKSLPEYPKIALKNKWEGSVELLVEIMDDGSIRNISLLKSSGYDILDKASIEAVKKWVFEPARRGDKRVDSKLIIPIRYKINVRR